MEVSSWINYIDVIMFVFKVCFQKNWDFPDPSASQVPHLAGGAFFQEAIRHVDAGDDGWDWNWGGILQNAGNSWGVILTGISMFMDDVHGNSLPTLIFCRFSEVVGAYPQFILHFRLGKNPWNQPAMGVPPWLNSETVGFRQRRWISWGDTLHKTNPSLCHGP